MKRLVFSLMAVMTLVAGRATAATITFEADSAGNKANGFVSVDSTEVSFTDTLGADLLLQDYGVQSDGQGLGVFGDDASQLRMNFTGYMGFLQIAFGNDDPFFTAPGDLAWLLLFDGATQVGSVSVVMNRNDLMDQVVNYSGTSFNNARFFYGNAAGEAISLIEVVDNISFREGAAVPEPTTMVLVGSGLLAAIRARRRARK